MFQIVPQKTLADFTTEQLIDELFKRCDFIQSIDTNVMIRELVKREVSLKEIVDCLVPIKVEKQEIQAAGRQNEAMRAQILKEEANVKKEEERSSRASRSLLGTRQELKEEFKVKQEAKLQPGLSRSNGQTSQAQIQNQQYYHGMNRLASQSESKSEKPLLVDIKQRSLTQLVEIAYQLELVSRAQYQDLKNINKRNLHMHPELAHRIVGKLPQLYEISGPQVPFKHYSKKVRDELKRHYKPYYESLYGVLREEGEGSIHYEEIQSQDDEEYEDLDGFINDQEDEEQEESQEEVEATMPKINPRHVPRKRQREQPVEEEVVSPKYRKKSKMELKSEDEEQEEKKFNKLKRDTSIRDEE